MPITPTPPCAASSEEAAARYAGHRALCEIDLPGQAAIERGRVLVAGAGGLGSPVLLYLAAAGVGHIGVVDADTVALNNLQRQVIHHTADIGRGKADSAAATMRSLNPGVEVVAYPVMVTADNASALVEAYDVVVDCTDNYAARLLISDTCVALGKPLVYGAVSRMAGMVFTYVPPAGADYRAWFGAEPPAASCSCAAEGILNTLPGVVGALQATEVLKLLAGAGDLLDRRLLLFDAVTMTFRTLTAPAR